MWSRMAVAELNYPSKRGRSCDDPSVQDLVRRLDDLLDLVGGQLPLGEGVIDLDLLPQPQQHGHVGLFGDLVGGGAGHAVKERQRRVGDGVLLRQLEARAVGRREERRLAVLPAAVPRAHRVDDAASAQAVDPNPGRITLTGGIDFANAYMFRGIPQDEGDFGSVMWPYADLGIAFFAGGGGLKSVGVNVGTWNSLHTGGAGLDGPSRKLWYESDFYATLAFGFGGGTTLGLTYTAYTSPNGLFSTVKEFALKFGADDTGYLGRAAVKPYVLVARELSWGLADDRISRGAGQADGGSELGTYFELGIAPGLTLPRVSLAVPLKVGLSLDNYYEGADGDERFGFFSIAGIATVPFTSEPTRFGSWNVHGGVEYLRLGDRNQGFGENQVIGSIGIGFSY